MAFDRQTLWGILVAILGLSAGGVINVLSGDPAWSPVVFRLGMGISAGAALCGIVLWLWPRHHVTAEGKMAKNDESVGIYLENCHGASITDSSGDGLSSFIRAVDTKGIVANRNKTSNTPIFADLTRGEDFKFEDNVHGGRAMPASTTVGPDESSAPKLNKTRRLFPGWRAKKK